MKQIDAGPHHPAHHVQEIQRPLIADCDREREHHECERHPDEIAQIDPGIAVTIASDNKSLREDSGLPLNATPIRQGAQR
jgi:hypothetical protein